MLLSSTPPSSQEEFNLARHSCLYHPPAEYFLRLFRHHVEVFGGDICCASIISILDYMTSIKIEEMEAVEETEGLLWVSVTLQRMADFMCGMYSIRRIQDRINFLISSGFIVVPTEQKVFGRAASEPMAFLLNRQEVDDAVRYCRLIPYQEVTLAEVEEGRRGTIINADDKCRQTNSGGGQLLTPMTNVGKKSPFVGETALPNKVLIEEKRSNTPLPPSYEGQGEDNPGLPDSSTLDKSPASRWNRKPKRVRRPGLMKRIQDQQAAQGVVPEAHNGRHSIADLEKEENLGPAKPMSLRAYLELWNHAFPDRAEEPPPSYQGKTAALWEPDFDPEKVFARVRQVIKDNGDANTSWLEAYWPLKTERETGRYNFRKLLKPGFMRSRESSRRSQQQEMIEAGRKRILNKGKDIHGTKS